MRIVRECIPQFALLEAGAKIVDRVEAAKAGIARHRSSFERWSGICPRCCYLGSQCCR